MAEYDEIDPPTVPGAGTNIRVATDTVTIGADTVKVQREKMGFGSDGQYSDVTDQTPLPTGDYPNIAGRVTKVAVTTAAVLAVATSLANRRWVMVQNLGDDDVAYGYVVGVTFATGVVVRGGQSKPWPLGPNIPVYLISPTAADVRFEELA